ncbi:MAG: diphosphate--fructose-6-phosphate 1-phosphotransferase, partial [Bacilli bacterium]|nr:diphosphate--fructose-6-phosphate 1-phosphotransferase [Bacilli bacterium]
MFHNCLYLQSGGPSAVINSTFQGLRDAYQKNREGKLFVSPYGISGLINEELLDKSDDTEDYSFLPGAHFGSLRKMLPEEVDAPIGKEIIEKLKKYEISHLFLNGGNDSMDTAYKIQRYFDYYGYQGTVLGLPKTIDNDLFGTDHTPGYGTAAKFVANATLAIYDDEYTYRKGKIILIETMGRDSGYVAASAKLCALRGKDPDYIYVPEVPFDIFSFLDKAIKTYQEKGHCIIVLSEGIRNQEGKLISDSQKDDAFGNRIVGGVSNYLTSLLLEKGYPARNIIFNTLNRSSSFLPSLTDINEARMVGS